MMSEATLQKSWDLIVGLDYGLFYLQTEDPYARPDFQLSRLIDQAVAGSGIAQHHGQIVVLSPHERNYAMAMRVELWDEQPKLDLNGWQEAFEFALKVGRDGLIYDSPTLSTFHIPVPPGQYLGLLCAQGFSTHERPGTNTPGDRWRLQLWHPSAGQDASRDCQRLRAWTDVLIDPRQTNTG
ncbi:hypothetical protein ACSMXN_23990 [Jatrophihabitans sp. DSM 45814]